MGSLTSPYRYAGGKSKLLSQIMEHLDPLVKDSPSYIEPFVGGGSVFLEIVNRYPDKSFYLNDKNYGVASFWSIVTGNNDQQLSELCNLIDQQPTVALHNQLREDTSTEIVISAYKSIFFNRCNFSGIESSGMIGGSEQKSKYKIDCRYNANKIKKKILEINQATRGKVTVTNLDINDYHYLWDNNYSAYLDPPYVEKGSMLYTKYMQQSEHKIFADKLNTRNNWLLSYDDHPLIRKLYQDREIIDLSVRYSINGTKEKWKHKNELLIKKSNA